MLVQSILSFSIWLFILPFWKSKMILNNFDDTQTLFDSQLLKNIYPKNTLTWKKKKISEVWELKFFILVQERFMSVICLVQSSILSGLSKQPKPLPSQKQKPLDV